MPDEAAAAQTSESATQTQESAPDTNKGKTTEGAKVETTSKQDGGTQPGVKREFFNLREKVRTEKENVAALRAELDALKAQTASSGMGRAAKPDPLEDPEAYSGSVEKRAEEAAARKFNELLSQHNVNSSAVHAEQWLRSRSHISDDSKAGDEIAGIIENQYAHLVKIDPRAAARSAYSDWCEMKGVSPDLSNTASLTPPRHAKPSSAGSGSSIADKVYTSEEVKRTLSALKSPEAINAYSAEVEKAAREGRYRGKAIHVG